MSLNKSFINSGHYYCSQSNCRSELISSELLADVYTQQWTRPRPRSYKTFLMLNLAEHKIEMLISIKMWRNTAFLGSDKSKMLLFLLINVKMPTTFNNCSHFNIYEQEKFHAQLSWAWKKFYDLGAWSDLTLTLRCLLGPSCPNMKDHYATRDAYGHIMKFSLKQPFVYS